MLLNINTLHKRHKEGHDCLIAKYGDEINGQFLADLYRAKEDRDDVVSYFIHRNVGLISMYAKMFYNEIVKYEMEDTLYLAVHKGLINYQMERGQKNIASYIIAYIWKNEIYMVSRKEKNKKNIALETPLSIDKDTGRELTYLDTLVFDDPQFMTIETFELLDNVYKNVRGRDREVIQCLARGMPQREIGRHLGISQSYVSRLIRRIQIKQRRDFYDALPLKRGNRPRKGL